MTKLVLPMSQFRSCWATQRLGAIVAGKCSIDIPSRFDCDASAKDFGIPAQKLWDLARKQASCEQGESSRRPAICFVRWATHFSSNVMARSSRRNLAETNERFRLLVEGVRDYALFTMDPTGRVTELESREQSGMLG